MKKTFLHRLFDFGKPGQNHLNTKPGSCTFSLPTTNIGSDQAIQAIPNHFTDKHYALRVCTEARIFADGKYLNSLNK